MANVNFFQPPTDTAVDAGQIQRQRALADMLIKQGTTQQQGSMVSGHYVAPGPLSYIAQLGAALAGGYKANQADAQERALAQTAAAARAQDASDIMSAVQGTPGTPAREIAPLTRNDDEGNPMATARVDATPGTGPDMAKALAVALRSQDPTIRGMAPGMMTQQIEQAALANALAKAGIGGNAPAATAGTSAPAGGAAPGTPPLMGGGAAPNTLGLNPGAFALSMSPNKTAQNLGKMVQEANKPQTLTEGGTLVTPDGRVIFTAPKTEAGISASGQPVPGFQEAQARRERLIAEGRQGAESANTMVEVTDANGVKHQMTRAQFLQMSNGGQQPTGGPATGQSVPNPMAPRAGDSDRVAIYQQERSNIMQRMQAAQQSGDQAAIARAQQDAVDLEKEIKSNKIPLAPLPVPGTPQAAKVQQSMPGIAGPDPTVTKTNQSLAELTPKVLTESREAAKAAGDELLSVQQARSTMKEGIYQGSGADTKLAVAKFINSWTPFNVNPEKVANTDYMKSVVGSGLLKQAKTLGANPTDADARRLEDILGTINKDPKAMEKLLDWRESMARRAIEGHTTLMQGAQAGGVRSPVDLSVQSPSAPASSNVDALLQKYR